GAVLGNALASGIERAEFDLGTRIAVTGGGTQQRDRVSAVLASAALAGEITLRLFDLGIVELRLLRRCWLGRRSRWSAFARILIVRVPLIRLLRRRGGHCISGYG